MPQDLPRLFELSGSGDVSVITVLDPEVLAEEKEALYRLTEGDTSLPLASQVVLNLAHVHLFRSTMIATLITFQRKLREKGGQLKLCCLDPEVLRLLQLTRMDQILDLRKDEREAVSAYQGSRRGWLSRLFGAD